MARKSRKDAIVAANSGLALPVPEALVQGAQVYDTGGYVRLSILETRDRKDSEALQTQKKFLHDYIEKHPELRLQSFYEDNGETGTNFQRSGFEALMADVRRGKINCIVVKDLSRFGREHLEIGGYLEHLFPALGVRFISIADGYDSSDATTSDYLKVALKNLVNQMYSKDISRKSGTVLRQKQQRGEFIGAYAAYGYLKDPSNPNRIIVDEEAAPIVREIFRRKSEGMGNTAITRWLNATGVLSPCTYRHQKGILLDNRFAEGKPWLVQTVKNLLRNQVYLGHMVQGRRISEYYAGRPDRKLPPEQWTVVEHTHPPLVSQEIFGKVQVQLSQRETQYRETLGKYDHLGKSENLLRGMVYCAQCGRPLVRYKQVIHGKQVRYYFMCPNYAAQLEQSGCSYKFLREDILCALLSELLTQEIHMAVDAEALIAVQDADTDSTDAAESLQRIAQERKRLEMLKGRLMQDYLKEVLTLAEFERMKLHYVAEEAALTQQAAQLEAAQQTQTNLTVDNPWLRAFGGRDIAAALTHALVQELVERITIHDNVHVEITFRFQDERRALLATVAPRGEAQAC